MNINILIDINIQSRLWTALAWGGVGWGDINIHIDINMNIYIHIIIDMNIENYIISYLLSIIYYPIGIN